MKENNLEEKDKEELELRRLRDIVENRDNLFNREVLIRFQRLEELIQTASAEPTEMKVEMEKLKKGVNQLLMNTEELLKSKETKEEKKETEVEKEEKDEIEDNEDSDDDLGYEEKGK